MNKETIEKAAMEYADNATPSYINGDFDRYAIADSFEAGAEWRINSVWHSTDELPKYSGFLAVLMDNGLLETMYYSAGIGFHEIHLKGYTSWAYISDLLPGRKEEEQ